MNFAEGLLVAANGIIVVFIVLISLCLVVKIISLVVGAIPDKEKQTTENNVQPVSTVSNVSVPQPERDIKSQGDVILKGVDDETAAAIMAAVSETARKNGENPKFKSIKKID